MHLLLSYNIDSIDNQIKTNSVIFTAQLSNDQFNPAMTLLLIYQNIFNIENLDHNLNSCLVEPDPALSKTFTPTTLQCLQVPYILPDVRPATCVPCPFRSHGPSEGTNDAPSWARFSNSTCDLVMPVSELSLNLIK